MMTFLFALVAVAVAVPYFLVLMAITAGVEEYFAAGEANRQQYLESG